MSDDDHLTPADMLARVAKTLHGREQWRMRISRDLAVDDDTIRRWMTGRTELTVRHGVFDDALVLLRRRAEEINKQADELGRWMAAGRWSAGAR